MKKLILTLLSSFLIISITGCNEANAAVLLPNRTKILVEIALTAEEKTQGLMFREEMAENRGMLFLYENPTKLSYWMKNTLIPLDIIFLNEDQQVINIESATPCIPDTKCAVYRSKDNAKYVLEINEGLSKKHDLKKGDKIEFSNIKRKEAKQ